MVTRSRTTIPRAPEGRLVIELRRGGATLARRRSRNVVLRSGAELVAALFRGEVGTPINGFAVGINPDPPAPPYQASGLTTTQPNGDPALLRPAAPVLPEGFEVEALSDEFRVRLRARGVLPADHAVSPEGDEVRVMIAEAGLGILAADGSSLATIYNRVVFEPLPKTREHELALYWEVDFPYGP
jgi:hypothetical protein